MCLPLQLGFLVQPTNDPIRVIGVHTTHTRQDMPLVKKMNISRLHDDALCFFRKVQAFHGGALRGGRLGGPKSLTKAIRSKMRLELTSKCWAFAHDTRASR